MSVGGGGQVTVGVGGGRWGGGCVCRWGEVTVGVGGGRWGGGCVCRWGEVGR